MSSFNKQPLYIEGESTTIWKKLFEKIIESGDFHRFITNCSEEDFLNLIKYIEIILVDKVSEFNQNSVSLNIPIDNRLAILEAVTKLNKQKSLIDEIVIIRWIKALAEFELEWIKIEEKAISIIK